MSAEDIDTTARTIYGEARGESFLGQVAVAWVIRNRAEFGGWWGKTPRDVCLKPQQFSCWNADDPNSAVITAANLNQESFARCFGIACLVLTSDEFKDPTDGATHYIATYIDPPLWAKALTHTVTIGHASFYK